MSHRRDYYDDEDGYARSSDYERPSRKSDYYEERPRHYDDAPVDSDYSRPPRREPEEYTETSGYTRDRGYSRNAYDDKHSQSLEKYTGGADYEREPSSRRRSRSERRLESPSPERSRSRDRRRRRRSSSIVRSLSRSVSPSRTRGFQRSVSRPSSSRSHLGGPVGTEKKDIAATLIGAIAGGFLAHEAGNGKKPIRTIGGAVLGGLAGNAIEHQHLKRQENRREREQRSWD